MPSDAQFISYAQNREDVVLWRALGHVSRGRYVEVGANDPRDDSVTRAFYDRGWTGITVEPMPAFADAHRAQRPRDTMVEAVITDQDVDSVVLHEVPGTGLSSIVDAVGALHTSEGVEVVDRRVAARRLSAVLDEHGGQDQPVQFLLVDAEGAEAQVLASVDLRSFRPWVLVVEATAPNSTEQTHLAWEPAVVAAGYQLCLFDGVSRFYVADEHAPTLGASLSYPACALDSFVDFRTLEVVRQRESLIDEVRRWRADALTYWAELGAARAARADAIGSQERRELDAVRAELTSMRSARDEVTAMRSTVSWRVTRPLRAVRRRMGHL